MITVSVVAARRKYKNALQRFCLTKAYIAISSYEYERHPLTKKNLFTNQKHSEVRANMKRNTSHNIHIRFPLLQWSFLFTFSPQNTFNNTNTEYAPDIRNETQDQTAEPIGNVERKSRKKYIKPNISNSGTYHSSKLGVPTGGTCHAG